MFVAGTLGPLAQVTRAQGRSLGAGGTMGGCSGVGSHRPDEEERDTPGRGSKLPHGPVFGGQTLGN